MKNRIVESPISLPTPANSNLLLRSYEKIKYELPLFVFFLILFVPQKISLVKDVYATIHVYDYSIVGFAPRLFIGSLMSLFVDYKSLDAMDFFMTVVCIGAFVLYAWIAGQLIRHADTQTKEVIIFLIVLFVALPYTLSAMSPRLLSADRFMVLITAFTLIALGTRFGKWLVPLLIVAGLATHQAFAFTYMPVVAILLLYRVYQDRYAKKSVLLCVVSFTVMALFSAYFFLYPGVENFANAEALAAYISDKTDFINHPLLMQKGGTPYLENVTMLLFKNPYDFWDKASLTNDYSGDIISDLKTIIFLLPLVALFFTVWKKSFKNASSKLEKFIFILCILAPLARIPMYILSQNEFRCRVAVIVVQFFLLFYFLYHKNPAVLKALQSVGDFFKKNYLLFLALVIYFALPFLAFKTGEFWNAVKTVLGGRF